MGDRWEKDERGDVRIASWWGWSRLELPGQETQADVMVGGRADPDEWVGWDTEMETGTIWGPGEDWWVGAAEHGAEAEEKTMLEDPV